MQQLGRHLQKHKCNSNNNYNGLKIIITCQAKNGLMLFAYPLVPTFFVQNLLSCCVDKFGQLYCWSDTKQVSYAYADACHLCTYEQCVANRFKPIVNHMHHLL
jgi:hypothetical protein